jgi:hypothetical protein
MHYFDVASLRMKYTPDEVKEDYSKKKYIAKRELASDDWKTQAAQRFKNIPKGAEVKMIQKEYWNYYGKFSEVEWNGHIYYVGCDDIEEIDILEKTNEKMSNEEMLKQDLEELKRLDIFLKLGSENSVSCFNYKGKNIACMSVNKYNELVRKSIKNKE